MKKLITTIAAILLTATFANAELTKETVVDKMEVLENGTIQVREATRIIEDGTVISQKFHRYVITPGQDVTDKDTKVQNLASSVWTDDVVNDYMAQTGQELTLAQQKRIKLRKLYKNIKSFINSLPDGTPRYDDDLKLGLMNAIMSYALAGQPIPENLTAAKTWLTTVQGLFVTKKGEIQAVAVVEPDTEGMTEEEAAAAQAAALETAETALGDIDVTVATLESGYGREGTILADPGVSTSDLVQ